MHCSQPFCGTGHPLHGQYYPLNNSLQCQTLYPEVIGEGDVASIVFPDGSIHLYFIPTATSRQPSSFPYTPFPSNNFNQYGNNIGAYYIRSVSNPISPVMFNQQCQKMYGAPYSPPCVFPDCNGLAPPGFQLKFHNDDWTSTTDLHYFVPSIRRYEWFPLTQPKQSMAVQVNIQQDKAEAKQDVICLKPCLCMPPESQSNKRCQKKVCLCAKSNSRSSISSKGSTESTSSLKKNSRGKLKKHKQISLKLEKGSTMRECSVSNAINKAVTTCTEQGTNPGAEQERNTQTRAPCGSSTTNSTKSKKEVKTELWFPKTFLGAEAMDTKSSEKLVGVYGSNKSSILTCCCSNSDTDAHDS